MRYFEPGVDPETGISEDEERMACAWSDYRSEYGVSGFEAYVEFTNGWEAARENYAVHNFYKKALDYRAGFHAYWGRLDIGGVMR